MQRNILTLFLALFASAFLLAQGAPLGMKYQAVARDLSANVLADKSIALQIDLVSGAEGDDAVVVYSEEHHVTTNALGLFTLAIGGGQSEGAGFADVPWSSADIWMRVRIRDEKSGDFVTISNSKMLSVPYAFYAATAGEIEGGTTGEKGRGGVPANVWSMFGNTRTDPTEDKLGTMDCADLVMVTNSEERLRILCTGEIDIDSDLSVGNDLDIANNLSVGGNTDLDGTLNVDQQTDLNSTVNVNNGSTTNLSGDVNVDGQTDLNGDVNVNNGSTTNLSGDLNVDGATNLNVTLEVDGQTDLNSTVNVNNSSTTNLSGEVNIEGTTNINNTVNVTNNNTTNLTGEVNVDGTTNINNVFNVNNSSTSNLSGDLNVDGQTDLNNTFNVNNGSTTNLSGEVNVDGATTLNSTLNVAGAATMDGSLTVADCITSGGAAGEAKFEFCPDVNVLSSDDVGNYPLQLKGATQGLAIELENIGPEYSYVSFFHPVKGMRGQIKSRSGFLIDGYNQVNLDDVSSFNPDDATGNSEGAEGGPADRSGAASEAGSTEVGYETSLAFQLDGEEIVDLYKLSLALIADLVIVATSVSSVFDPVDIFEAALASIVSAVDLATFIGFGIANVGVAYESGSGDYAEWLEKADYEEHLIYGDVVGVIGGKVSKEFTDADQFMVVSAAPAVLGAMPAEGDDEANYATIAFMGQVPVKVRGEVKVSDFILPSGDGDGLAIAVSREDMRTRDYGRIIGVAWHDSDPEQAKKLYQMINVAVGINQNDMANVIEGMQGMMNAMQTSLAKLDPEFTPHYYDADAPVGSPAADMTVSTTHPSVMSGYFDGKTYETTEELGALVVDALETQANIDLSEHTTLKRILLEPEYRELAKVHYMGLMETYTQWSEELVAARAGR